VAAVVWILIALLLAGVELFTLSFVAVYPAVGALAAALTALLGANLGLQLLVFAVVSVGALLLTRKPLMRAMKRMPSVPSNAPTVLGKRATVVIPIEEGPGQRGQVRVGTEHWSARSDDERPIAEGTTVEVVRFEGVALVVRPVAGADAAPAAAQTT
jgi:membrane protein implicated in regulation of membrane protease activity